MNTKTAVRVAFAVLLVSVAVYVLAAGAHEASLAIYTYVRSFQ